MEKGRGEETDLWKERYSRQIPLIGVDGQKKLQRSRVLIAGVGGLGCVLALYTVAAGFGKVILVDNGVVELSNLNRQVLYSTNDIGKSKVEVAKSKLEDLNPNVEVIAVKETINEKNAEDLVREADIVLDGLDNWKGRFALNDAIVKLGKPFVHAGVRGWMGQLLVVLPGRGPCLRCVFPAPPRDEGRVEVIGVTPATLALMEVAEAIKLASSCCPPSIGRVFYVDLQRLEVESIEVHKREGCSCNRDLDPKPYRSRA